MLSAAAPAPSPVDEAERLAATAVARATAAPAAARDDARRALELTRVFDPMRFAKAGRKGEVLEDEFLAARTAYRRHRAKLYAAMGEVLGAAAQNAEAARFLARAAELDPARSRGQLGEALVRAGRARDARGVLLSAVTRAAIPAEDLAALQSAVDAAGLPSVQAEIDRKRLEPLGAQAAFRYGPLAVPPNARLSSGALLRLDAAPLTVFYLADASCRSCSKDLEALKRAAPADAQVLMVPASRDDDTALRRSLSLYHYDWPVLLGPGLQAALGSTPPGVLVAARNTFVIVTVPSPFDQSLPQVLEALARTDVRETVPRANWSRRPPAPPVAGASSALLPNGLAPAENGAPADEVTAASQAFDAKQPAEALRLFTAIAARWDGTLLLPEADYNRALCLAALGRREEARKLLLGIGDSRFQEDVDRALERIGSAGKQRGVR